MACDIQGWLIAEESLGISCSGTMGIITSDADYFFAAGKNSALKQNSLRHNTVNTFSLPEILTADCPGGLFISKMLQPARAQSVPSLCAGKPEDFPILSLNFPDTSASDACRCRSHAPGGRPVRLSSFSALTGRMSASYDRGLLVVDNANSGTNLATTVEAARSAPYLSGIEAITLVIGKVEGDGAVCEGFAFDQIRAAIDQIRPAYVVGVGAFPKPDSDIYGLASLVSVYTPTLAEAYSSALHITDHGSIVLAVKTWR